VTPRVLFHPGGLRPIEAVASFSFTVPGQPIAWARAGSFNGRRFTPARMRDYQKEVRFHAVEAAPDDWPLDHAKGYRVRVAVYLGNRRRADLDNFAKSITDALQGRRDPAGGWKVPPIAYDDDTRIVELHALKLFDQCDPRVLVEVETL